MNERRPALIIKASFSTSRMGSLSITPSVGCIYSINTDNDWNDLVITEDWVECRGQCREDFKTSHPALYEYMLRNEMHFLPKHDENWFSVEKRNVKRVIENYGVF